MAFNSFHFLIFFPIVVLLYYIIPRKMKRTWLLIASYYFYMSWNYKYSVLILTSTVITYISGLLLDKTASLKSRKCIVALSFVSNIGILIFFKYFGFLLENVNAVLNFLHISEISNPFSFLLPVGISFYTFQALSYTVDVYKNDIKAEKNFVSYALFVSFFPQLVAGPIERSGNLLNQIRKIPEKKKFDYDKFVSGFGLMLWGLFVKMVIADRVSIFVDNVFSNLQAAGTFTCLLAAFGFALQIYCDFGGYSLIATGAAKIMGFDLMENFNTPYFSESIKEFWRRWHISLSGWFKDYLYIPLGGNRKGRVRKYINILITFLVSGLWHGAMWTFVVWGALHGFYQVAGELTMPLRNKLHSVLHTNRDTFSFRFGRVVNTFLLTSFAWIFFRAESLRDAGIFIKHLFTRPDPWVLFNDALYSFGLDRKEALILWCAIIALVAVDLLKYRKNITLGDFLVKQNLWFRWMIFTLLAVCCLVFGKYGIDFDSAQFIYFQF